MVKKVKKEHGDKPRFKFFENDEFSWDASGGNWVVNGDPDWIDRLFRHIDVRRQTMAIQFPPVSNAQAWVIPNEIRTRVRQCATYDKDVFFLRFELDELIRWYGYEFWNHVHDSEYLKSEKGDHREADRVADLFVQEFQVQFALGQLVHGPSGEQLGWQNKNL